MGQLPRAMNEYLAQTPPGVWVDVLALLLLLAGIWQGKRRGLKAECVSALAFLASAVLVWWLHPYLREWMHAKNLWGASAHVLRIAILIITALLFCLTSLVASTLLNLVFPLNLEPATDHALGLFPGIIRGAAYVLIASLLLLLLPAEKRAPILETSHVGLFILPHLPLEKIPANIWDIPTINAEEYWLLQPSPDPEP